jgi:hypothetical protein
MQTLMKALGSHNLIDRAQKESRSVKGSDGLISRHGAVSLLDREGHDLCVSPPSSSEFRRQVALLKRKRMAENDYIEFLLDG